MSTQQLKRRHDALLAQMPEEAVHAADECPLCALESTDTGGITTDDQPKGGSMSDKTYSQEDLDNAVKAAIEDKTSELQAKLSELQSSQAQSEIDAAIASAKAEREDEVKELQSKLDTAVAEAAHEKQTREDLEASIEAEKTAAEEAAALEARKEARTAQVKEAASFSDEYISENADRWARLSDDEFARSIEDWKAIASKSDETIPSKTAMTASRTEGGTQSTSALGSLRDVRSELVGKSL